jgi:hypothetical protein
MHEAATSVIKNDEVKIAGKVRLGSSVPRVAPQAGSTGAAPQRTSGASSARIVGTGPDHVIVEVTCPCGTKTMLRCNF